MMWANMYYATNKEPFLAPQSISTNHDTQSPPYSGSVVGKLRARQHEVKKKKKADMAATSSRSNKDARTPRSRRPMGKRKEQ